MYIKKILSFYLASKYFFFVLDIFYDNVCKLLSWLYFDMFLSLHTEFICLNLVPNLLQHTYLGCIRKAH